MNLYFWHNIISPHQAPFMRELASSGHKVTVVTAEAMSETRHQMGWNVPSLGKAQIVLGPDEKEVFRIVNSSTPDSIHFIAGARGIPLGKQVAQACRKSPRRMGIITESPDPRGFRGFLRRVKYTAERVFMGRHFDFILAMGQKGFNWFKLCGYKDSFIFPFAYVTDRLGNASKNETGTTFRFVFVGQLIPRKGVDFLLHALAQIPDCELVVIGDGVDRESLQKLALESGIGKRVIWLGKMDLEHIQNQVFIADILVLPSREDGWGAVVNESLMVGTPVICSNACGAAELIRHSWLGTVFPSGNIATLAEAMTQWCAQGKILPEQRQRIQNWAQCIEAPSIAKYVEEVTAHVYEQHPRPQVPWRS